MNEELNKALDQISDKHINKAANYKHKRRPYWIGAVAAAVAATIALGIFLGQGGYFDNRPTIQGTIHPNIPTPGAIQSPGTLQLANLAAAPMYPVMVAYPNYDDYNDNSEYNADYDKWKTNQQAQYNQPVGYADSLDSFFQNSIKEFLSSDGNRAYSPLNVYLALAMLAETTDGDSQQQILDLLGTDSIDDLRIQAGHVWNAHYCTDGQTTSLLANSLWLDEQYDFKNDTVQTLANDYFASVFHADLGSEPANEDLRTWINSQTGGLLAEQAQNLELDNATVFALASTAYFSAGWKDDFSEKDTAERIFHCDEVDLTTQFMNQAINFGTYYWDEDFGAVKVALTGNNAMWLILPDEGKTVEDVLDSGKYWEMTQDPSSWKNRKTLTINLSLPKFDINSKTDLIEGVKKLGITDIFNPDVADFRGITDAPVYTNVMDHAARVAVDEEGVIGAAYTVIGNTYGSALPYKEIDFTLDRPFLFVITSRDNLPLFAGVVEQP